ncbi:unnamed protein product [Closterium sp. NIES-64]|nr:unnamed protein product [Closterium sp. NIES-64]
MRPHRRLRESLTPQQLREWYAGWGCRGGGATTATTPAASTTGGGQMQLPRPPRASLTPQQLREWYAQSGGSLSSVRCSYVILTGARTVSLVGHLSPAPGTGAAAALGASESASSGAGEAALSGPSCVPLCRGRLRAAPHSSQFPPTEAPLQTLHMDVWGPAPVRGQGHERYFLLVVDDYSRYTTVFPLRSKGAVTEQNGIAERRIGMVMDVARTSMMHAAAPHFLWPFAVRYAAHQLNLHPRVSRPDMSPVLLWTGKVGDASAFRVWGSRAFVRDLSADKLSPRAAPCVFLGFPPDAPGWQFYHPSSRRVLSSQDVTFDESVPFYRLFPYRTPSLPPPPDFLVPVPPPVDPLPPQVPAPSGVSQVDTVEPVEVAAESGPAAGAESGGATPAGAELGGAAAGGAEPGGARPGGAELGGAAAGGAEPGSGLLAAGGVLLELELLRLLRVLVLPVPELLGLRVLLELELLSLGVLSLELLSLGAESGAAEPGGATSGAAEPGVSPGAASRREPLSPQELREWFARRWRRTAGAGASSTVEGTGAAGPGGATPAGPTGAGAAEGVGAESAADCPDGGSAAGAAGGPAAGGPVQSQSLLEPTSPLPAPSPYTGPTGGLAERREPASRPASPVGAAALVVVVRVRVLLLSLARTGCLCVRPLLLCVPFCLLLLSPPLPVLTDPESDSLRAASPTVTRLLATVVTDPSFESAAASALVAELVDFAARCRLDYAASLDRQEEFQCLAAASPHLASVLLAPEGDPDALDIPTPRSYAEAVEGPYSSQWQAAMDAEMASWKSTGTYVDAVPPPGANIVSGMWIFRVKRPRSLPCLQGAMTTLRVLLHIAAQRNYELHSLDFSTAFLAGEPARGDLAAPSTWLHWDFPSWHPVEPPTASLRSPPGTT